MTAFKDSISTGIPNKIPQKNRTISGSVPNSK